MTSMSASEARAALPELLNRVEDGEEVVITRHGRPVAVLVRPDALRARRAETAFDDAARIHALLAEAAVAPLPKGAGLTEERAEELIAEIRASRDARLWTASTRTRSSTPLSLAIRSANEWPHCSRSLGQMGWQALARYSCSQRCSPSRSVTAHPTKSAFWPVCWPGWTCAPSTEQPPSSPLPSPAAIGSGLAMPPTSPLPWPSAPTGSSPTTSVTSPPKSPRSASHISGTFPAPPSESALPESRASGLRRIVVQLFPLVGPPHSRCRTAPPAQGWSAASRARWLRCRSAQLLGQPTLFRSFYNICLNSLGLTMAGFANT